MVRCRGADRQGLSRRRRHGFGPSGGLPINRLFFLIFSLLLLSGSAAAAPLRVTGLQLGLNAGLTRMVVEADGPLAGTLAAAPDGLGLVLTLNHAGWAAATPASHAAGLVAGLGLPVDSAGQVSFGLDLVEPAVVERAFRLPPQGSAGDRRQEKGLSRQGRDVKVPPFVMHGRADRLNASVRLSPAPPSAFAGSRSSAPGP